MHHVLQNAWCWSYNHAPAHGPTQEPNISQQQTSPPIRVIYESQCDCSYSVIIHYCSRLIPSSGCSDSFEYTRTWQVVVNHFPDHAIRYGALILLKKLDSKATYPKQPFDGFGRRSAPLPLAFWNRHSCCRGVLEEHAGAAVLVLRLASPSSHSQNYYYALSRASRLQRLALHTNGRARQEQELEGCYRGQRSSSSSRFWITVEGLVINLLITLMSLERCLISLEIKISSDPERGAEISLKLFCNSISPWGTEPGL